MIGSRKAHTHSRTHKRQLLRNKTREVYYVKVNTFKGIIGRHIAHMNDIRECVSPLIKSKVHIILRRMIGVSSWQVIFRVALMLCGVRRRVRNFWHVVHRCTGTVAV